jgi:hypothetical protein
MTALIQVSSQIAREKHLFRLITVQCVESEAEAHRFKQGTLFWNFRLVVHTL